MYDQYMSICKKPGKVEGGWYNNYMKSQVVLLEDRCQ